MNVLSVVLQRSHHIAVFHGKDTIHTRLELRVSIMICRFHFDCGICTGIAQGRAMEG